MPNPKYDLPTEDGEFPCDVVCHLLAEDIREQRRYLSTVSAQLASYLTIISKKEHCNTGSIEADLAESLTIEMEKLKLSIVSVERSVERLYPLIWKEL